MHGCGGLEARSDAGADADADGGRTQALTALLHSLSQLQSAAVQLMQPPPPRPWGPRGEQLYLYPCPSCSQQQQAPYPLQALRMASLRM